MCVHHSGAISARQKHMPGALHTRTHIWFSGANVSEPEHKQVHRGARGCCAWPWRNAIPVTCLFFDNAHSATRRTTATAMIAMPRWRLTVVRLCIYNCPPPPPMHHSQRNVALAFHTAAHKTLIFKCALDREANVAAKHSKSSSSSFTAFDECRSSCVYTTPASRCRVKTYASCMHCTKQPVPNVEYRDYPKTDDAPTFVAFKDRKQHTHNARGTRVNVLFIPPTSCANYLRARLCTSLMPHQHVVYIS